MLRLRGSIDIEHTLAELGAERLWELLHDEPYVDALGALTGNQAIQQVRAGLKAIYLSGWQVAADANLAGHMYPDQSLYPSNSVPQVVKRINQALQRADQIDHSEGKNGTHWFAPIVADAEAGFGGCLNAFELMKPMIEAGAAAVHFEDQLASEKKCGHLGGKVLVPTSQFIRTLSAARLAADVMGVPTLVVARTDANSAHAAHQRHRRARSSVPHRRAHARKASSRSTSGVDAAIARATRVRAVRRSAVDARRRRRTSTRRAASPRRCTRSIPGKLLAYNCSPSFNWAKKLSRRRDRELPAASSAALGYKFQFVTLAGFHALNFSMFELARQYRDEGMTAYSRLQQAEFAAEEHGYTATKHQHEVGTGYFDEVMKVISHGSHRRPRWPARPKPRSSAGDA